MTRRKITITLTEAQYGALASAVAFTEVGEGSGMTKDAINTMLRAWWKINRAWHAKERRGAA